MKVLVLWLGFFVSIALGQSAGGGHISSIIQSPAALVVFGPCFVFLVYRLGIQGTINFLRRVIKSQHNIEDSHTAEKLSVLALFAGAIGAVIGLIHVLENLSDTSRLGSGIALSFVAIVYGALPAMLFLPLSGEDLSHKKLLDLKTAGAYSLGSFMTLLFSVFVILYAVSPR